MLSDVESIEKQLEMYFKVISWDNERVTFPIRKIDTKELERSLTVQAVTVDRKTYVYVSQAFSVYKKLGYTEIIRVNSKSPEDIKYAKNLEKHMKLLHLNIDNQIKRFTKKIE